MVLAVWLDAKTNVAIDSHEVAVSHVEHMEQCISVFIRKWLGISSDLTSVALYGRGTKAQLPLKALTEEFKITRAKVHMAVRDSEDQVIRDTLPAVKTGRRWSASTAVAKG